MAPGQSGPGGKRVAVLGVPYNSSGTTDGVARAPAALRAAGLIQAVRDVGVDAVDRGDIELGPTSPQRDSVSGLIAPDALTDMIRAVRGAVAAIVDAGWFPVALGGDCPILLGCLRAIDADRGPGLLFVDGHEDAWPPTASTTGEAADMELGLALGFAVDGLPGELAADLPRLEAKRVIVLGPRDERELASAGVRSIDDIVELLRPSAIRRTGPVVVGAAAAARLAGLGPWWLHVDLDVLATTSLAAVDYRQPGGLDWAELTALTKGAFANPNLIGFDVTIYNPDLDVDGIGARRIVRYVAEVLRAG